MNIYQKIIKVMESIEYLKKDDEVGKGTKAAYKAISDEKVKKEIRNAMIKNGLVMFRTNVETEVISREYIQYNTYTKKDENKIQHFCKVKSTYKIVNADNPEESEIIQSIGHGVDPQDKAAGKAMTYAAKYAMLDTFIVPTGEDSDKTHSNDIEQPVNKTPQKKETASQKNELPKNYLKNLQITAKENNYDSVAAKALIIRKYKKESSKDLTIEESNALVKHMKANPIKVEKKEEAK